MAFKYQGDSILGVSLTVESPKPLDTRMVVSNSEELYTIPSKYAYQGMPVVNASNGNIYVLVDKSNIDNKLGWKASYEAIQIIACTKEEYDEWLSNTDSSNQPIDEDKAWIHEDTYYYIYEESIEGTLLEELQYLSRSWGEQIEALIRLKANGDAVDQLSTSVTNLANKLDLQYITEEVISQIYIKQSEFDLTDSESFISKLIDKYYTKTETDGILNDYVKKSDLEGDFEGEGYAFVTQSQYANDKQQIQDELDLSVKTNSDAQLNSVTTDSISSSDNSVSINIDDGKALLNGKDIATFDLIPELITLSKEEYEEIQEQSSIKEDAYYYIYDQEDNEFIYVTKEQLDLYYTKIQIRDMIAGYYTKEQIDQLVNDRVIEILKEYNLITEENESE